jgi:hypothetical protein
MNCANGSYSIPLKDLKSRTLSVLGISFFSMKPSSGFFIFDQEHVPPGKVRHKLA